MELTDNDMLEWIRIFLSKSNDYDPLQLADDERKVVGCYNAAMHDELGALYVFPPVEYLGDVSLPVEIGAYELLEDGRIILCTVLMDGLNIKKCLGNTIKDVYKKLVQVNDKLGYV